MGGRGIIEDALNSVFKNNLVPERYRRKWEEYGQEDSSRTEKALLRHALSHLLHFLDGDDDVLFPEEVYICPPHSVDIQTGSIVRRKADDACFIILNPSCDLVVRKSTGRFKATRILLVEVEDYSA